MEKRSGDADIWIETRERGRGEEKEGGEHCLFKSHNYEIRVIGDN